MFWPIIFIQWRYSVALLEMALPTGFSLKFLVSHLRGGEESKSTEEPYLPRDPSLRLKSGSGQDDPMNVQILETPNVVTTAYCSFAYSALACFRMGMSGSASFQRVRKSL